MSMISLTNVSKVYGKGKNRFAALQDIHLTVNKGETIAIVGKSGSGKSTLMHVISGLDSATSGEIRIEDKTLTNLRPTEIDEFRSKDIGFIFQSFFIEPYQTCLQNVILPLEIAKVPKRLRKERAQHALEQVGLSDKEQVQAVNLSGGQKQRLAIARAIVNKPKIIFADEPTGNLDSTTGEKIISLLFSLNKKLGVTLLLVTHDHELAQMCNRQINIKDGKIDASSRAQKKSAPHLSTKRKVHKK